MFVTRLGIIPIPEPYATRMRHGRINVSHNEALEVAAWLNGQAASRHLVEGIEALLGSTCPLPPLPPYDSIKLVCSDYTVTSSESYLRRHFHFIDDYLSEFPDEKSVTIPFSSDDVTACISDGTSDVNDDLMSLVHLLDCLSFLNPKDPLYYFRFSTCGLPIEKILELYSLLTEDAKVELLKARSVQQTHVLPHCKLSTLAHLLEFHVDVDHLVELFSNYPSYLAMTFAQFDDEESYKAFERLMLTVNFAQSSEVYIMNENDLHTLNIAILELIQRLSEWNDLKRILTMIGATHKMFDNEEDYIPAPYFIKFVLRDFEWRGMDIAKIVRMKNLKFADVLSILSGD